MKENTRAIYFIYSAGIFSGLLGLGAMVSWYSGTERLFQINSSFIPVAFNTALCHFICALAIISIPLRMKKLSMAAAIFVAVFAAIVGSQYLVGRDFGIDSLFVNQREAVRSSYPGRMAPNTVLYFILTSASLLSWYYIRNRTARLIVMMIMGVILLLLSLIAILGYLIKIEAAYSWWGMSDMAFLTAIGFLSHSIGILGLAYSMQDEQGTERIQLLKPILISSIGITLTLLINQSLLIKDRYQTETLAREQASKTAHIIRLEMENDVRALMRMQDRMNYAHGMSSGAWQRDASNYLKDDAAYLSFAMIDENLNILQEIVNDKGTFTFKNKLTKSRINLETISDKSIYAVKQDVPGTQTKILLFFLPVSKGNKQNFLVASYDVGRLLHNLPTLGYGLDPDILISDEDGIIYSSGNTKKYIWEYVYEETIEFHGIKWQIRETLNLGHPTNRALLLLILFGGIGLSLVLAQALWQKGKIALYVKQLQIRDERYARTISAAQVGLWDWDLTDNSLRWHGSAWVIMGAQKNDDLAKNAEDIIGLIHEDDRKTIEETVQAGVAGDHMFNVEYRTKRLDGKETWVQSRGRVVEFKDGNPVLVSGTLMDINKRKLDEEDLARSNQELQRFAYVASHDLKAPLRSIDNLAKWVLEDTVDSLPTDAREKLEVLRGRVARLEALLEDILTYSRAGRIVDEPVRIDIKELLGNLVQSHVSQNFEVVIVEPMPVLVSPRTPLEQIFGNLLTNAIKHHDRGAGKIVISAQDRGAMVEFTVSDDGPGIPPAFHERVFEMFQTLQPRDKVDGSGIGMSIIKKLVEWRGGKVWIESRDGERGTKIHFCWPKN